MKLFEQKQENSKPYLTAEEMLQFMENGANELLKKLNDAKFSPSLGNTPITGFDQSTRNYYRNKTRQFLRGISEARYRCEPVELRLYALKELHSIIQAGDLGIGTLQHEIYNQIFNSATSYDDSIKQIRQYFSKDQVDSAVKPDQEKSGGKNNYEVLARILCSEHNSLFKRHGTILPKPGPDVELQNLMK